MPSALITVFFRVTLAIFSRSRAWLKAWRTLGSSKGLAVTLNPRYWMSMSVRTRSSRLRGSLFSVTRSMSASSTRATSSCPPS